MGEVVVRFNGSDDPPVDFVNEYRDPDQAAESFSSAVFQVAWRRLTRDGVWLTGTSWADLRKHNAPDFPLLQASEPLFGKRDINELRKRFSEGFPRIVTGRWQNLVHPVTQQVFRCFTPTSLLRFFGSGLRVEITGKGNPERRSTEAHREISADTSEDLVDALAQHLWDHRTLAKTLTGATKAGKAALAALRRR